MTWWTWQDRQDRNARTWSKDRTAALEGLWTRLLEQDIWDRTARSGQLGQDSLDKTDRTGQLAQDKWDRPTRTAKWDTIAETDPTGQVRLTGTRTGKGWQDGQDMTIFWQMCVVPENSRYLLKFSRIRLKKQKFMLTFSWIRLENQYFKVLWRQNFC
jgi:hypothetical protein